MGKPALALAIALISAAAPAFVRAAEGYPYTVRVNAPGPLDDLLRDNLDLLRFRNSPRMDREQLLRMVRAAPEQVRTLVATAGYYSPVVGARLEGGDGGGANPVVVVDVQPGEPVRVDTVEIALQGFASTPESPFDTEALKASWTLSKGEVFRQDEWERAKRALLRQVVQTRYPRAQLTESLATVDPDRRTAALRVALDSGPELRFGELRIEGLKRYPESVVRNLNQIKPGEYYNEAALQAYQSRLQDTGYFASVEVSADTSAVLSEQLDAAAEKREDPMAASPTDPAAMAPLPLLVRVVENKRRNVSAGVGYSTNTGNRAQLNYDDLAIFGLKMKSALTLETKKQTARGDFYFPVTPDGYSDSFGAAYERSDIEGEETTVFTVSGKRAWGTPLLERSVGLELLTEQKSVAGQRGARATSLPLTYSATRRKVDNLLFPTKGYVLNWQLGGALLPLLTDEPFIRVSAKGMRYLPFGAKQSVILRGEVGALASRQKEGVPAVYLFRAGGDQSVRGYAYQELGVDVLGATVGGRYLATASAEYQYWFKPAWGAAVFYDAGNAADSLKDLHPKSGYGVGARWKSPVGPINVDLAYGHAVKKARLHFSLGFTF
ncbi:autotransporter assembly complex protein TamA [Pseudoduganella namucuonensis]|uniref:Autotransporter secretion outer membrane protein TamA n=1 Tax=Pseudoduganella namucuonensis TaxID=1035707 RepID=A0A1I7IG86_9BURK|nr:autotransporter assembly complex family protein [Pseudoduganella namucuonensis]SFU71922.1 autotransporter secretion outer membrane protein TamA [Pseudoduganella namucuonensis]